MSPHATPAIQSSDSGDKHKKHSVSSAAHLTTDESTPSKRHRLSHSGVMPSSSSDSATLVDTVEDNSHPVDDTLKNFTRKNSSASSLQSTGKKIKLVTGSHAKALHQYLLKNDWNPPTFTEVKRSSSRPLPPKIMLAIPGKGAARKVVDYYMASQGKTGTQTLKGPNRRKEFLDDEFVKVDQAVKREYKRQSMIADGAILPNRASSEPVVHQSERENQDVTKPQRPAFVTTASAVSIPFLGRSGVVDTEKPILQVMNPDPSRSSRSRRSSDRHSKRTDKDKHHKPSRTEPTRTASLPDKLNEASNDKLRPSDSLSQSHHDKHAEKHKKHSSSKPERVKTERASVTKHGDSSPDVLVLMLDEEDGAGLTKGKSWHRLDRLLSTKKSNSIPSFTNHPPPDAPAELDPDYDSDDSSLLCSCSSCSGSEGYDYGSSLPLNGIWPNNQSSYASPPPLYSSPSAPTLHSGPMMHASPLSHGHYHSPPVASPPPPGYISSPLSSPFPPIPTASLQAHHHHPLPYHSSPAIPYVTATPPGFVPLVVNPSTQSLLDEYAAGSPYATRPSLYLHPQSPNYSPHSHISASPMMLASPPQVILGSPAPGFQYYSPAGTSATF